MCIRDRLKNVVPIEIVSTLEEAVAKASQVVLANELILLAPAANSFDAYPNFEIRGEHYRQLVTDLNDFIPWSENGVSDGN